MFVVGNRFLYVILDAFTYLSSVVISLHWLKIYHFITGSQRTNIAWNSFYKISYFKDKISSLPVITLSSNDEEQKDTAYERKKRKIVYMDTGIEG